MFFSSSSVVGYGGCRIKLKVHSTLFLCVYLKFRNSTQRESFLCCHRWLRKTYCERTWSWWGGFFYFLIRISVRVCVFFNNFYWIKFTKKYEEKMCGFNWERLGENLGLSRLIWNICKWITIKCICNVYTYIYIYI